MNLHLENARHAAAQYSWSLAVQEFQQVPTSEFTAADYEAYALSAWWMSNIPLCIEMREKEYAMLVEEGKLKEAGVVCISLAKNYYFENSKAISARWHKMAREYLEKFADSAEYGWLLRLEANAVFEEKGPAPAIRVTEEALALAIKHHDKDLESLTRQDIGRYMIANGDVKQGLEVMEHLMVQANSANVQPLTFGLMLCNMIDVCDELVDYQRAMEWDSFGKTWCTKTGQYSGFPGLCRVKRAGLMRRHGAWMEAEKEALKAKQELTHFVPIAKRAIYEVGEIRLRLGDYEKAREAFQEAQDLGLNPQPGLAMLYDLQGQTSIGFELLESTLAEIQHRLWRVPSLLAFGQLALKLNKLSVAEESAHEIESIGQDFDSEAIRISATYLKGLIEFSREQYPEALETFRTVVAYWLSLRLPYESAQARMHIALCYCKMGKTAQGKIELEAALREFERLGAKPDVDKVNQLLMLSQAKAVRKAMMFTDIVGSTTLIETIGDNAWKHILQWHDRTLRNLFVTHRGREVSQAGDGFFVEFDTAQDALACAQDIQKALMNHRATQGFAPNVRIGLHVAEVSYSGSTLIGLEVHKAARIAALADAGQIVVSTDVAGQLDEALLGERKTVQVKGIQEPVEVVFIDWQRQLN